MIDLERQLCGWIRGRAEALLDDLRGHVAIRTGHNHVAGLDAYRRLLVERLSGLGVVSTEIPGDRRPEWLWTPGAEGETGPDDAIPPSVVAEHEVAAATPRVLLVGHLDTVHEPAGPFQ